MDHRIEKLKLMKRVRAIYWQLYMEFGYFNKRYRTLYEAMAEETYMYEQTLMTELGTPMKEK